MALFRRSFLVSSLTRDSKQSMNEAIRAPRVQLITDTGENKGVVSLEEALASFDRGTADLIQVGNKTVDGAAIPIARILLRATRLEAERQRAQAPKVDPRKQKKVQQKQLFITTACGEHDLRVKYNKMLEVLKRGASVEVRLHQKTNTAPTVAAAAEKWPQLFPSHPSLKGLVVMDKRTQPAVNQLRQARTPTGLDKKATWVEDGIEKSMYIWRWTLVPKSTK